MAFNIQLYKNFLPLTWCSTNALLHPSSICFMVNQCLLPLFINLLYYKIYALHSHLHAFHMAINIYHFILHFCSSQNLNLILSPIDKHICRCSRGTFPPYPSKKCCIFEEFKEVVFLFKHIFVRYRHKIRYRPCFI